MDDSEMHELSFDEIAEIVLQVAMKWVAVAFVAGLASGLVIGVLM